MTVKLSWISQSFAIFSCGTAKVSIALLILRIKAQGKFRKGFLYIIIAALTIINTVGVASIFFQCSPSKKLWDPSVSGSCLDPHIQRDIGFAQASYSAFSDFVLAVFPLTFIWNLKIKMSSKIGLGCAMSLGVIVTGAAIVKTILIQELSVRSDYTYITVNLVIWSVTEMYTIIIAACIPTLRPLLPILCGKPPSRRSYQGKQSSYFNTLHLGKVEYVAYDNDASYSLQTLKSPPRSYKNFSLPGRYWPLDRQAEHVRRGSDIDSNKSVLPKSDSNEIVKDTEIDAEVQNNSTALGV